MGLNADEGDGGDFLGLQGVQNLGECHGEEGLVVGDGGGWKNRSELAHGSSEARGVLGREEERDGESASSMDEFPGCRYAKTGMCVCESKRRRGVSVVWCCWVAKAAAFRGRRAGKQGEGRGGKGKQKNIHRREFMYSGAEAFLDVADPEKKKVLVLNIFFAATHCTKGRGVIIERLTI